MKRKAAASPPLDHESDHPGAFGRWTLGHLVVWMAFQRGVENPLDGRMLLKACSHGCLRCCR